MIFPPREFLSPQAWVRRRANFPASPPRGASPPQPPQEGSEPCFFSAESSHGGAVRPQTTSLRPPTSPEGCPPGAILQWPHLRSSDPRLCVDSGCGSGPLGRGSVAHWALPPSSAPPRAPVTTLLCLSASLSRECGEKTTAFITTISALDLQMSQLLQLGPGLVTHRHALP